MPSPRMQAVGAVIDGVLHVVGGYAMYWDDGDEDGRVYPGSVISSYDIAADTWSERTPTGKVDEWSTHHEVVTAVAKDGTMYMISKESNHCRDKRTIHLHIFNPKTFNISRGPDLPSNQGTIYGGLRAGLFQGKVTVVGLSCDNSCYVLDEDQNSWRLMPPAEGAKHWICPMTSVATVYK